MPQIKLGSRPKSFARVVKFKDVDGTELTAPITYKYRTRKEFGEWLDALPKMPEAKDAAGEDGVFSSEKYLDLVSAWNANKIEQMLEGWGLDEEFTAANIKQLCVELPACADAVIEEYRAAILEGHLGN